MLNMIEIWGYLSMLVVIWSMTMENVTKLRIVNSISCGMFIVYAVAHNAWPLIIMNSIVIFINMWRVLKPKND